MRGARAALLLTALALGVGIRPARAQEARTVALWLFDEPVGLYPSDVLGDASASDYPMVLGPGGEIVPGRHGRALAIRERVEVPAPIPTSEGGPAVEEGNVRFGVTPAPTPAGRSVAPLWWGNARFAALMTSGEGHLRKEVGFANATDTKLNLGDFDWTVEAWYRPGRTAAEEGTIFEVGAGPRGENGIVTRLSLAADRSRFTLVNQPSATRLAIPTDAAALDPASGGWHHLAFVYDAGSRQLRHYVDGTLQPLPERADLAALPHGEEAYFTVGRDGRWERPLPGALDELRFSTGRVYDGPFDPPASFAPPDPGPAAPDGPPPLFAGGSAGVIRLGGRKHLFIDDALVDRAERVRFTVNPPRPAELVIPDIQGPFRKHLTVIQGDDGIVRIYNGVEDDRLAVHTSRDGVHFEDPDLGTEYRGHRNIAVDAATATGTVFIDPNAPPEERWKYVSGFHDRGLYLFSSPDGWHFTRHPTALLPNRVGSQDNDFWDDQRGVYVAYHRSDCRALPSGETRREWVRTETKDVNAPWPFRPMTPGDVRAAMDGGRLLRDPQPWFMDNGPLTPGGFCLEFPTAFAPVDSLDPLATDIYVPKAMKYPWAEDTYLAFPSTYFHYWDGGPPARRELGSKARHLGSGPIETQMEVSRDGIHWKRYPRPVYIGIGRHAGYDVHQAYIANGMVRRGNEIWQYYFGTEEYHSSLSSGDPRRGVFRVVQRLDGFVSVDTPYDTTGMLVTRPLTFEGDRLVLNIDTNATGYAQVGLLDENGAEIPGYGLDDCVYVNGDFIDKEVEWMEKGSDLSALEGRVVRVAFRMRGAKLYAMQFVRGGE